jgi:predicted phosphodiesterase
VAYPLTAILSDLHGNAPALETALADARERGARRYVCLGDVIGYGARPRHNLDWVMRLCTDAPEGPEEFGALEPGLCLQGNHEYALLNSAEDFNARARAAIEWTREELNRDAGDDKERRYAYWDFLAGLEPVAHDGTAMFAHGSPRDPVREYMLPRDITDDVKMRANWQCMEEPVCFVGHSHVPAVYFEDRRLFRPRGTEGPY